VFDDGGEEALFLHEHGVPFEVIPGVPAALGGPAYAGVAVTYRGGGDTLTLVRGHEDASRAAPDVDWRSLAHLDGTLVCYAGPTQVPGILDALRRHGRPADEPVALVTDGTLPTQQTITGTVGSLADRALLGAQTRPAIMVVGRVAALREHLRWFDVRPLFGRRIVVTRPREHARELIELLEEQGAHVIEAPTVRIASPSDYTSLDTACADIGRYHWVVLPSAAGADAFLRRLLAGPGDIRSLHGVRICAIGQASVDRFSAVGVKVDVAPEEYRPDTIAGVLSQGAGLDGQRILIPHIEGNRDILADELRRAGADVTTVPAYRTERILPGDPGEPDIHKMLLEQQVDVMVFTSASTVRDYARDYGPEVLADLLRATLVAAIGPVTAQAAEAYGIRTSIMPAEHTIPALAAAVVSHFLDADR
jgi:uroporphyrinogen III methyltransferase/synthase